MRMSKASATRIERFTGEVTKKWGVELVDSIEALCSKVDAVMVTSVDGRQHLAQVRQRPNRGFVGR